jgi:hypothetical protein
VTGRHVDDQIAMEIYQRIICHYYAAIRPARECGQVALDLVRIAHVNFSDAGCSAAASPKSAMPKGKT